MHAHINPTIVAIFKRSDTWSGCISTRPITWVQLLHTRYPHRTGTQTETRVNARNGYFTHTLFTHFGLQKTPKSG